MIIFLKLLAVCVILAMGIYAITRIFRFSAIVLRGLGVFLVAIAVWAMKLLGVVVVITLPLIGNVMIGGGVGALIGLVLALIVGKIGLAAMGTAFSPPMLAIVLLFSFIAAIGAFFGGFGIARILLWPAALPLLVLGLWFLLRRKPREAPIEIETSVPVTKEPA